eukprot:248171_1
MESVVSFYCFVLVPIPFRIVAALIQFVVFIVIVILFVICICIRCCFPMDDMPLLTSIDVYFTRYIFEDNKSRNKIETDLRIDKPKDLQDVSVKRIKKRYLHNRKKDIERFEESIKNNTPFIIPNCDETFGNGKVILHGTDLEFEA